MRFGVEFLKEASRLKGGAFHNQLKEMREMYLLKLVNADKESDFRFLQGTIQAIDLLIEAVNDSREAIEKLDNKKPDMNKVF